MARELSDITLQDSVAQAWQEWDKTYRESYIVRAQHIFWEDALHFSVATIELADVCISSSSTERDSVVLQRLKDTKKKRRSRVARDDMLIRRRSIAIEFIMREKVDLRL